MMSIKYDIRVIFILISAGITPATASAEDFIGIYGGYQFEGRGTNVTATEDIGYTSSTKKLHSATSSDLKVDNSMTGGVRVGRYFENLDGFGIEGDLQYSQPDFTHQNVTINLTDGTKLYGSSKFTENQLPANFFMYNVGFNFLYRYNAAGGMKPYVGAGPALYLLNIDGSGDSCNIIDPIVRPFCSGGIMKSKGWGLGVNAKVGLEMPITDRLSFSAEYKLSYAKMNIDWFRSFSDVKADLLIHNVTVGLMYKF